MLKFFNKFLFFIVIIIQFNNISCNSFMAIRSEKSIGRYILSQTNLGSTINEVRNFINENDLKIYSDRNTSYTLRGTTVPEQLPSTGSFDDIMNRRGSSHIWAHIAGNINIVAVMCAWVFDEDGKLIFVDINKSWNWL